MTRSADSGVDRTRPLALVRRAGGVAERANLLLRLGSEIDQVLLQDAQHTVQGAVDFLNALMVQGLGNDAGDTGVDDSGGAAGLAHQNISYEFSHDRYK